MANILSKIKSWLWNCLFGIALRLPEPLRSWATHKLLTEEEIKDLKSKAESNTNSLEGMRFLITKIIVENQGLILTDGQETPDEQLNPEQKEAVLHKDGALLIIAGAGAGKTKTLTSRIFHLIQNGVAPRAHVTCTERGRQGRSGSTSPADFGQSVLQPLRFDGAETGTRCRNRRTTRRVKPPRTPKS